MIEKQIESSGQTTMKKYPHHESAAFAVDTIEKEKERYGKISFEYSIKLSQNMQIEISWHSAHHVFMHLTHFVCKHHRTEHTIPIQWHAYISLLISFILHLQYMYMKIDIIKIRLLLLMMNAK